MDLRFWRKRGPDVSLDSIQIDTSGWTLASTDKDRRVWQDQFGNSLCLDLDKRRVRLPPPSDKQRMQRFCRGFAEVGDGAIVSGGAADAGGVYSIEVIRKHKDGMGYRYTGLLAIPFTAASLTVVVAAREHGMTGTREAVVTKRLIESGELELPDEITDGSQPIKGWFRDPYESDYKGRVLCSISDSERYDDIFPDHPLSIVRRTLNQIRHSLKYEAVTLQPPSSPSA